MVTTSDERQASGHKLRLIFVNDHEVRVEGSRRTGLEIKQAAIEQGVPIQLHFVLSLELGHGNVKLVPDEELVEVRRNSRFLAIPDDDNS